VKVAILAGGRGTRLAEETGTRPKAMVEIGGRPILWHLMKIYARFGFTDFVIALGHRGDVIKTDLPKYYDDAAWNVTMVDTGEHTETAGRILRLRPFLGGRTFFLTWCDGLARIDLNALVAFHRSHGRLATVTAVHPPARFGSLELDGAYVTRFVEKRVDPATWINGAFFVLEPGIFAYIEGDATAWEAEPLEKLAHDRQLMAFRHEDYWQCMDTLAERRALEVLWADGTAPWKVWS
jgi:glucose-1-phosphate cytidylyltransferase